MQIGSKNGSMMAAALTAACFCATDSARAEDARLLFGTVPTTFVHTDTENLFGFTEGSSIGFEGEREIGFESVGAFRKRDGAYQAWAHKLQLGYTPNQSVHLELGVLGTSTFVKDVTGLENVNATAFGGLSGELKWLLLARGPASPIGVALSVEPRWAKIDDATGERVQRFSAETALRADAELVPDRLFLGLNAVYEPEVTKPKSGGPTEHASNLSLSGALSYRLIPTVAVGGEVQYMRAYDMGVGLNHFLGDAVFVGPSLFVQFTNRISLTLAWGHQVAGRSIETPGERLNLVDFSRDIGKVKANFEF
jgi:hypothetical protein